MNGISNEEFFQHKNTHYKVVSERRPKKGDLQIMFEQIWSGFLVFSMTNIFYL